jgi:hypothetical protein
VTVVQRTSSELRLNPHLRVVFLDGTYHEEGADLVWQQLGHLQSREVGEVRSRRSAAWHDTFATLAYSKATRALT